MKPNVRLTNDLRCMPRRSPGRFGPLNFRVSGTDSFCGPSPCVGTCAGDSVAFSTKCVLARRSVNTEQRAAVDAWRISPYSKPPRRSCILMGGDQQPQEG